MHQPEQHRIDVDGHGVGGERLLGGKAGRDGPLIDTRGNGIDEGDDPEQARPAETDEASEAQHDRALPLARETRRLHQRHADDEHDDQRHRAS